MLAIAASWLETQLRRRVLARGRRAAPPSAARRAERPIRAIVNCRRGAVAFEFVLVAPVLLLVLFATMYLGVALNNYLVLTAAAEQGAQTLSLGRGTTTPYTTTTTAINAAGANLTTTKIVSTVKIGASSCTSDASCTSLLTAGAIAAVSLTYPCNLTFMGISFAGSPCLLSAQSAAVVQ